MSNSFLSRLTAGLARVGPSVPQLGPTRRDFLGLGLASLVTGCIPPLSLRGSSNASNPVALSGASLPSFVQPLDPAIRWDWPSIGNGQISLEQFNFCDTQPVSSAAGTSFVSGSGSFSDAYAVFLELLDAATFVPASVLASARRASARPAFAPSLGVGPPGWVAVPNSGGVLEFKPEWAVAIKPSQGIIDQSSGFQLNVSAAAGFLRGTPKAAALDPKQRGATMSFKGLARVPVYAGAWYSEAFVRIAASGPFLGSWTSEQIVGPNGILRCRVTEFFVASEITASATLDDADAQALLVHLVAAPTAKIGSVAAGDATLAATPAPGGTTVKATTTGKPFIIAASVQSIL